MIYLATGKDGSPPQNRGPFRILAAANPMLIKVYRHTADAILFSKRVEFLYHPRQYLRMGLRVTLAPMGYDNVLAGNPSERGAHHHRLDDTQHAEFCPVNAPPRKL